MKKKESSARQVQQATLRVRLSHHDQVYNDGMVTGSKILELFGDVANELLIRHDGSEALLRSYDNVDFLYPVYQGDYIEVTANLVKVGTTSRLLELEAYKVIQKSQNPDKPRSSRVLKEPKLIAQATGTYVIKN